MSDYHIVPLPSDRRRKAKQRTADIIHDRIGDKPRRADFVRDVANTTNVLDIIAMIVFTMAFIASSIHIMQHMASVTDTKDFFIDAMIPGGATVAHIVTYIFLSELSMILFMTMYAMRRETSDPTKWVFLGLAVMAGVFVVIANLQSGIGTLESIMPPAFTIGIGFYLEKLITRRMGRVEEVDARYHKALNIWEIVYHNPEKHNQYEHELRGELWEELVDYNRRIDQGMDIRLVDGHVKNDAINREMHNLGYTIQEQPAASMQAVPA